MEQNSICSQLQLSVIIVSYNVKYFLEQCLCSLQRAVEPIEAEVWVVDNASTDGSVAYLSALFPWVRFIANDANLGFGKANNQVLYQCTGDLVLFLNPDTLLPDDCLLNCINYIGAKPAAGAIGVRMIDGSGRFLPESKRSFPTPATAFYKLTGLSALFPKSKVFSKYNLGNTDQHQNQVVEVLSGAFFMVRRKIALQLKGFDESFFMYGEDIDFSYRIGQLGYRNYYFSDSTIIHFKGESARGNRKYVLLFYQAMSRFVEKHYKGGSARLFAAMLHLAIWTRAGVSEIGGTARRRSSTLKRGEMKNRRLLVVGTAGEYAAVCILLQNAGSKSTIIGRVAIDAGDNAIGSIEDLASLIKTTNADEIIFCGGIGYKTIITIMERIGPGISYRFHGKGTNSIAGSDSRYQQGEWIAAVAAEGENITSNNLL